MLNQMTGSTFEGSAATIRPGTRLRSNSTLFLDDRVPSEIFPDLQNDYAAWVPSTPMLTPVQPAAVPVLEASPEALLAIEDEEQRSAQRTQHLATLDTASLDFNE
jgi:hypothetical protein